LSFCKTGGELITDDLIFFYDEKPNVLAASNQGSVSGRTIGIQAEETMVIVWK
jgi:hypothetical protein